jgi:hypothetical protein
MKALVAYDSLFGNTELIARAVAAGLGRDGEVEVARLSAVKLAESRWQLVVIGAPTQRRAVGRPTGRLLRQLDDLAGVAVAAFDTRYRMPRLLSGAASVIIVNQLRAGGAVLLTEPASFFVRGREGPLEAGEVERAQAWGATIRQLYERRFS